MEQYDVLRKRVGRVEVCGLPPLKAYPDMSLLWLLAVLAGHTPFVRAPGVIHLLKRGSVAVLLS